MDITVQNLIDAIRKNGLIKIQGNYYAFETNKDFGPVNVNYRYEVLDEDNINEITSYPTPIGGCAYGQAANNLGVEASDLDARSRLTGITIDTGGEYRLVLNDYIRHLNDDTDMSLGEIADKLEEVLTDEQRFISFYV